VALLRASVALHKMKAPGDEQFGVDIVRRACEEPVRQIVLNSGTEGAIVVEKIKNHSDANFGYNASTDEYEDLVKAGVIDPTKVTRTALQNAASIAFPDVDHRSDDRRHPGEEAGRSAGWSRPRGNGLLTEKLSAISF